MTKFKLKKYEKQSAKKQATCFRIPNDIVQTITTIQSLTGLTKQDLIEQMVRHCINDIDFLKHKQSTKKG